MKNLEQNPTVGGSAPPPIQSLKSFCRETDLSPITAWRLRRKGWLTTTNISGRVYITAEAVAEFVRRAAAGEFSKIHKVPDHKGGSL